MIVNDGKYYLYRHIRVDKNEPFYIGIGTKNREVNTQKSIYFRAYNKSNRSRFWKNIKDKTQIIVEILLESDDYNFICLKEIEFIKLYGRSDLNKGSLVNLTDGDFFSKKNNKKVPDSQFSKIKSVKDGLEFDSIKQASVYYNINPNTLRNRLISEINSEFIYINKKNKEKRKSLNKLRVIHKITGIIYESCSEAARIYGYKRQKIQRQLTRNSKICEFKYYDK